MNNLKFEQELRAIVYKVPSDILSREMQRLEQLLRIGVDSERALRETALDESHSVDVRAFACWLLGRLTKSKEQAGEIIATLIQLQGNKNVTIRIAATQSLGSFQSEDAVNALIDALRDDNVEVRKISAQSLAWTNSEKAVIALVKKLKDLDEEPSLRGVVAETLGNSGDQSVIHDLIRMLDSEQAEVRFWSIYALGELCAEEAISKLEQLVSRVILICKCAILLALSLQMTSLYTCILRMGSPLMRLGDSCSSSHFCFSSGYDLFYH